MCVSHVYLCIDSFPLRSVHTSKRSSSTRATRPYSEVFPSFIHCHGWTRRGGARKPQMTRPEERRHDSPNEHYRDLAEGWGGLHELHGRPRNVPVRLISAAARPFSLTSSGIFGLERHMGCVTRETPWPWLSRWVHFPNLRLREGILEDLQLALW